MTSPFGSAAAKPSTGLFGSAPSTQPSAGGGGGGGLFGNAGASTSQQQPQPQPQQQQPGTFGTFTAQPAPQAQPQQPQQPAGGGLFGAAQSQAGGAQPAAGGTSTLFGQPQAQPQQQQQQPVGGGLFGAGQSQAGAQPAAGGTSTLFGQPQPQPQQQQPAGGGLFGAAQTQAGAQPAAGSTSLFGQPQQQQQQQPASGGLFGAAQSQAGAQPAGGTLFGQPQPQQQQQPAAGGLFGAGQTQAGAQPAGGTSTLFGPPQPQQQQQQPQPQPQGSSLFGSLGQAQGNPPGFPPFGQPQPAAPAGGGTGLFGSAPPSNPLSTSAFSQPTPTVLFGRPTPGQIFVPGLHPSSATDNSAQAQSVTLQRRIEAIIAAWNPASPQCRFQHYFYNLVDPRQVSMYGRPQNAGNDALWIQAVRENPDPTTLVPVLACGFDDLQKRVEAQSKQASLHQEKLKELQTRLAALAQTHVVSNTLRTTRALQTHTLITHRLMRILEHLHLLIPSLRSAAISPEEEALRARLERLRDDVQRGIGGGGGRGRINELWALLGAVQAARESAGRDGALEWKVVDKEGLERLSFVMSEQQQGLAHLMNIINRDANDLNIIEGERGSGGVSSQGTSPLRGAGSSSSKDFLQSR